jgi:7,8-dihydropterin-6-yl-methyl-4-(beta-D-ribofuranosyl)aminobenzene 5'-phosphate synthase
MPDILAVDQLEVLVLVDNVTDSLSTNSGVAISEWTGLLTAGRLQLLSGRCTCCAHHGLSLLITARSGSATHTVLFDTGPEASTFLRNAEILGVDFAAIDAVVLSHGHWDHGGGLVAAIEKISRARNGERVDCFTHPGMFAERALQRPNGELLKFESVPDPDVLAQAGANVVNTRAPQFIAEGAFYLSGEIPRGTSYETGFPDHVRRSDDGQSWEPDPLIMDERFISVHVKDKGQVVFSVLGLFARWHRQRPDSRAFSFPVGSALRRHGRAAPVRRDGKSHPGDCRRSSAVRSEATCTGALHRVASDERVGESLR